MRLRQSGIQFHFHKEALPPHANLNIHVPWTPTFLPCPHTLHRHPPWHAPPSTPTPPRQIKCEHMKTKKAMCQSMQTVEIH